MQQSASDKAFTGAIPEVYERYMVPMIFAPYATDLARSCCAGAGQCAGNRRRHGRADAGTGPGAAAGGRHRGNGSESPHAGTGAGVGIHRPITWQVADAMHLPFDDGSFDLVVCQFGVMFFPDKPAAFAEARRVLAPGGTLLFNVWDRIEDNDFADIVTRTLARLFPDSPPDFMARTPHGYYRQAEIAGHLQQGGFRSAPGFETLPAASIAASPHIAALAYCHGTPLRADLEARGPDALQRATDSCEHALAQAFGTGPVEGRMQAHVVAVLA